MFLTYENNSHKISDFGQGSLQYGSLLFSHYLICAESICCIAGHVVKLRFTEL
jgi:hypothetical protein